MATDVSRKGSFLERLIARLFDRIGFDTKLNSKEFGFESDVIAKKKGFTIIVEAKQYEGYINLGALIDQWANRAKRTNADRVLLVVTGHKNIPEKYYDLAKQEGIYLWNEDTVHNLNDIETKEQLYYEIGKRLEFAEIVEELEKKAKKIRKIKIISIAVIALLLIGFFIYSFNFQSPQNENTNNLLQTENQNLNEPIISPEQELINFCTSQFSNEGIFDLKKTDYQTDFSSASDWIRDNYENSALTQEQKEHNINYIIENQLPKQGYPIIITSGSKKEGQVTSQGFYYCNENGVI